MRTGEPAGTIRAKAAQRSRGWLFGVCLAGFSLFAGAAEFPRQTNSLGMIFTILPAGSFKMGSTPEFAEAMAMKVTYEWYRDSPRSESPQRQVTITRSFALSIHETRLRDFAAFIVATGYRTDAERDGKGADGKLAEGKWADSKPSFNWREMGFARRDEEPVVNVSWNDARAFCAWLSRKEGATYRLPAEAEWEYACRAGTTGPFHWGEEESARGDFVWSGGNAGGMAHPVMTRKPNPWGLFDMNGNAYEYCSDTWSMEVPSGPLTDPTGPRAADIEGLIVVRGGSWGTAPIHCRSAFRGSAPKDHRNRRDGFRVALEVGAAPR